MLWKSQSKVKEVKIVVDVMMKNCWLGRCIWHVHDASCSCLLSKFWHRFSLIIRKRNVKMEGCFRGLKCPFISR